MADTFEIYKLGDFKLKSGDVIPDAVIAYKEVGDASKPAIIYPTWYSGGTFIHRSTEALPDKLLAFPSLPALCHSIKYADLQ